MELRPYQKEAKEAIFEQWDSGVLKTLLVLPTGCGKTVVFAKVTEECVRKGDRVLILAHRGELLDQAADKLMKTTGLGCALEKAESSCQGSWFRVVVGSVQTLMREKRLGSFPADYFNTIIIDEAHHCISDSYQRVLQHFPEAQVLGVTATPDRGDMRNLGVYFESLAYEYTLPKAIKEGLSHVFMYSIPVRLTFMRWKHTVGKKIKTIHQKMGMTIWLTLCNTHGSHTRARFTRGDNYELASEFYCTAIPDRTCKRQGDYNQRSSYLP